EVSGSEGENPRRLNVVRSKNTTGTTVTTGHPVVARKPSMAGTTVTTGHPVVASKPVMAGATVTTGHPKVASKPVMTHKTLTTARPPSKPVVAGTTDVTTGTCGNSGCKETENFTVFISNIPYECHYHEMKRMFEQCGSLIKFTMPRGDNGHRGYAFAQYENNISYAKALMLNGHKVSGSEGENPRRLNVVHSKTTSMIHSPKTPVDQSQNTRVGHSWNTSVDHSQSKNNISYAETLKLNRHDVSGSEGENRRRLNVDRSKNSTMIHSPKTCEDQSQNTPVNQSQNTPVDHSQNTPVVHSQITPVDHSQITPVVHSEEPFKTRVFYNRNRLIGSTP
ncbi:hypothetical protein OTU49_013667, partial [Cherax quadricarinatus]